MVSVNLHGGKQMVPKTWKLKRARVVDFANSFFGSCFLPIPPMITLVGKDYLEYI